MKKWQLWIVLGMLASGCGLQLLFTKEDTAPTVAVQYSTDAPTATSFPTATPEPPTLTPISTTEEPALQLSKSYEDAGLGFVFNYPGNWAVAYQENQSRGGYFQFTRVDFQPDPNAGGLPEKEILMQVSLLNWEPKGDLAAYLEMRRGAWDSSGVEILSEEYWHWNEDVPAVTLTLRAIGGNESVVVLITVGDRYLSLSAGGNFQVVKAIARSLWTP